MPGVVVRAAKLSDVPRPPSSVTGPTPTIETAALSKFYGPHRGIENVTVAVEDGEVFGLLGPNGAGKTTLIRTLLDLLHPSRGSARIFGLDTRRDSAVIRRRLGNLPGDFAFGKRSTGAEMLSLLAALREADLGYAHDLARRFRADLSRPLGELSRGNRQKVGLISALFHRPDLLILDEPTSGLDPLMQEEFLALVGEEQTRGCTILMSSHELDEVERVCERVGIIRDGRLIAVERVADLLNRTGHRVSVTLGDSPDPRELAGLAGVSALQVHGSRAEFTVSGDLNPLLRLLARREVSEIEIAHLTLEEVFLSYYGDGNT
jgi:ABC-2 type transport system ATP-binding protein